AAVGWCACVEMTRKDGSDPATPWTRRERLRALIVTPDASVREVDLGDLAPIEALVRDWRAAVDAPVQHGRAALAAGDRGSPAEIGESLRKAVLDPLFSAAPDAKTFYLCVDSVLHLVPLDALPMGSDVVGDRFQLRFETSFTRLVARAKRDREASVASPPT